MAQTNYYIGKTANSAGESEINLRLYVSRDIRIRIGSGIWIDRKRWGKKNDINIPLIQGEEREQLLGKRSRLKALTYLLEQEINTAPISPPSHGPICKVSLSDSINRPKRKRNTKSPFST